MVARLPQTSPNIINAFHCRPPRRFILSLLKVRSQISPYQLLLLNFSSQYLPQLKDLDKQLTQAATDTRDAQNERDNVIKQSHASQLQLDTQAQDILKYKSSVSCLPLPHIQSMNGRILAHASRAYGEQCPPPYSTLPEHL